MCPMFTSQLASMNKKFEAEKSFPGVGTIRKDGRRGHFRLDLENFKENRWSRQKSG